VPSQLQCRQLGCHHTSGTRVDLVLHARHVVLTAIRHARHLPDHYTVAAARCCKFFRPGRTWKRSPGAHGLAPTRLGRVLTTSKILSQIMPDGLRKIFQGEALPLCTSDEKTLPMCCPALTERSFSSSARALQFAFLFCMLAFSRTGKFLDEVHNLAESSGLQKRQLRSFFSMCPLYSHSCFSLL
jgi:hypothetical protein